MTVIDSFDGWRLGGTILLTDAEKRRLKEKKPISMYFKYKYDFEWRLAASFDTCLPFTNFFKRR